MMNDATMEENRVFCKVIVRQHDVVNAESTMHVALTRITIELVLPIKLSTNSLSWICASDEYSFQYEADVSPYLHPGALITLSPRYKFPQLGKTYNWNLFHQQDLDSEPLHQDDLTLCLCVCVWGGGGDRFTNSEGTYD